MKLYIIQHKKKLIQKESRSKYKSLIIKLLEENIAVNLHDCGFGNEVLHTTPTAQAIKEKIGKIDF